MMNDVPSGIRSFTHELRRRRVYRAGVTYAAAVFILLQVADLVFPVLQLPTWLFSLLVVAAVVLFPVALVLGWAFELTPEGIRADTGAGITHFLDPRSRLLVAGTVLLLSLGMGWLSWHLWLRPGGMPAAGAAVDGLQEPSTPLDLDPARLAVLYLDDHSHDQSLRYVANGVTEALLHELSQVEGLHVISRNGVKPYRPGTIPLDSIVRALRVGSVVEGSVARSGDRLRVTVQLIDAASGTHLDSRVVERPMGDLFDLQNSIIHEVAEALRQRLGKEIRLRSQARGTQSVEAWTAFRRAQEVYDDFSAIWKRDAAAGRRLLMRADSILMQSERLDPTWVEPVLLRGWITRDLAFLGDGVPGAMDSIWIARAAAHAERAVRLAARDPAAFELRGAIRHRLSRAATGPKRASYQRSAEADLRRAVELNPRQAGAWWALSELLLDRAETAEAERAAERALSADAFLEIAPLVVHQLYYSSIQRGPTEEAIRWCDEGRRRFPEHSDFILCQLFLLASFPQVDPNLSRGWVLADSLTASVSALNRTSFRAYGTMQVAKIAARAGLTDSARTIIRLARGDSTPEWLAYDEAHARLLLGEQERAIDLLALHLSQDPDTTFIARDWWFEALRPNPRFRALVGSARLVDP